MWQGASSDYLQRFNRTVQLQHNPRWAHVREPTRDGVSMLMQYRQGELREIEKMRAEQESMHTSMAKSKAEREAESANYIKKLKGYSEDLARFKQQYSERIVSDGRPAVSDSGNAGSVRSELPDEAAMEPGSDDGGPEEDGIGLDVEAAPSGVQADLPGRP
jgi:hypothetical protein